MLRHTASLFCHQRGSQSSYGALVRWKQILSSRSIDPPWSRGQIRSIFVFSLKCSFCDLINSFCLEVARGGGGGDTCWGGGGGGHFGVIVLRHTASLFCHHRGSQSSYGALVRCFKIVSSRSIDSTWSRGRIRSIFEFFIVLSPVRLPEQLRSSR